MANLQKMLSVRVLIENSQLATLKDFVSSYGQKGNKLRPVNKNDADQTLVEFDIATPDAAVWLYGWIHKFKFDGDMGNSRDAELEWITGSDEFRKLIYAILYKGNYNPEGRIDCLKYKG